MAAVTDGGASSVHTILFPINMTGHYLDRHALEMRSK